MTYHWTCLRHGELYWLVIDSTIRHLSLWQKSMAKMRQKSSLGIHSLQKKVKWNTRQTRAPGYWMLPLGLYPTSKIKFSSVDSVQFRDIRIWARWAWIFNLDRLNEGYPGSQRFYYYWLTIWKWQGLLRTGTRPTAIEKRNPGILTQVLGIPVWNESEVFSAIQSSGAVNWIRMQKRCSLWPDWWDSTRCMTEIISATAGHT